MTKDPLRERPSSTIVHTAPRRSRSACARETSSSHVSAMSLAGWRPIVDRSRLGVEHEQPLGVRRVAVEDERLAAALGVPPRLELGRSGAVQTAPIREPDSYACRDRRNASLIA